MDSGTVSPRRVDVSSLVANAPPGLFLLQIIAVCVGINMLEGFDAQAVSFLASDIAEDWKVPVGAFGAPLAATVVGGMLGYLVLGSLSDRIGRKAVLLPALFVLGGLTLLTAFTENLWQLTLVRFCVGVAMSGITLTLYAIASEYAPSRYRAVAVVIVVTSYPLGAALGGLVSAQIMAAYDWRAVLLLAGTAAMIAAPVAWFFLPESVQFMAVRGRSHQAISRILAKLSKTHSPMAGDVFVVHETPSTGGGVRDLFARERRLGTIWILLASTLSFLALFAMTSWLPTILRRAGSSMTEAMNANAVYQLGAIIGGIVFGVLLDRMSARAVLSPAFFGAAISLVALAFFIQPEPLLMALVFALGFTLVGGFTGLIASVSTFYPVHVRAVGIGWAQSAARLGGVMGASLGGVLIGLEFTHAQLLGAFVLPCVLVGFVMLLFRDAGAAARKRGSGEKVHDAG